MNEPKGLSGWLIIPALGLIVLPIRLTMILINEFLPLSQDGVWQALTTPGTEFYHELIGPVIIFEIAANSLFIVSALILLYLYFTKSYRFPKFIIIFYIANFIFVIGDYFVANMITTMEGVEKDPEVMVEVFRSIVTTFIWVPYFFISKRVKNTFVKIELDDISAQKA